MQKIVITGGPCAGKTSITQALAQQMPDQLLSVPEAATIILSGGFSPQLGFEAVLRDNWQIKFQKAVVALQKQLEDFYLDWAHAKGCDLILCDSGSLTGAAYFPGTFEEFCQHVQLDPRDELNNYTAIIHLESLAVSQPDKYGQINNLARFYDVAGAKQADAILKQVWSQHTNYSYIPSQLSLADKIKQVVNILNNN